MATIADLSQAMFGVEGVNPHFTPNNNPGNLVFAGQNGAVLGAGGFAKFPTYDAGVAAAQAQITLDLTRGTDITGRPTTTLSELIKSWSTTDQSTYISTVAANTGIDPNADLSAQLGFPPRGKAHHKG